MARLISKNNFLNFSFRKFGSLDFFTKLFIITIIMLAIATPFVVYNYQLFHARGETQDQALQSIQQLQRSQDKIKNAFARNSNAANPSQDTGVNDAGISENSNLIGVLQQILIRIVQIFK